MNKNFLKLSLLCALSAIVHATASPTYPDKKIVLFGIKGVLLYPDMHKVSGGGLGGLLGMTPEKVERELFEALEPISVYHFPHYTRTYPAIIEAWLVNVLSNDQVHDDAHHYIKKHCGLTKRMRLSPAADIAFSYKQAGTFSTYNEGFQLARNCKSKGLEIGLCSSWNRELFETLKNVQSGTLGIFGTSYISGYIGTLAATPSFYDAVLKDYAPENVCLVDCLPENIRAAKARGIKTIFYSNGPTAERELKKLGFL
jgi:FMN phosphatase YigB (HAD superfamily)